MAKKHKFTKFIVTIADIGTEDGVCYFKETHIVKYLVAQLKRLIKLYEGYNITIYDCKTKTEICEGVFDPWVLDELEDYLKDR